MGPGLNPGRMGAGLILGLGVLCVYSDINFSGLRGFVIVIFNLWLVVIYVTTGVPI